MLQRAASNAYSWWWASHVRTKQSRWLEENLQDMEEKVSSMLKIIENAGESFAQRAEMYYRKRPELIHLVEDSYRAYRALAERYDHLSKDFQSANHTIATIFPEEVHFHMDDNEEESNPLSMPALNEREDEEHKAPGMDIVKAQMNVTRTRRLSRCDGSVKMAVSQDSDTKSEVAEEELDKLQKEILALQTQKEFLKGIHERCNSNLAVIENQLSEKQDKVCRLQGELGAGDLIDDDVAWNLMATTALNSCQETLTKLQEKQVRTAEEAMAESRRIKEIEDKFSSMKTDILRVRHEDGGGTGGGGGGGGRENNDKNTVVESSSKEEDDTEVKSRDKVIQLTDKIEELVDKVGGLETEVSSQGALISVLRSKTNELEKQIRVLEEDKRASLEDSAKMENKVKELENDLQSVRELNESINDQREHLKSHLVEANSTIVQLSEELQNFDPGDEEPQSPAMADPLLRPELQKDEQKPPAAIPDPPSLPPDWHVDEQKRQQELPIPNPFLDEQKQDPNPFLEPDQKQELLASEAAESAGKEEEDDEEEEEPNWRRLFESGLEGREKHLLHEYTSVLRNYKETRRKLNDVEKKHHEGYLDLAMQISSLKTALQTRDQEIQSLRKKSDDLEGHFESYKNMPPLPPPHREGSPESITQATTTTTTIAEDYNLSSLSSPQRPGFNNGAEPSGKGGGGNGEDKFRAEIDQILEGNLELLLRFSTSFHQVQKFHASIRDLKMELATLSNQNKHEGPAKTPPPLTDTRPIYKHLREIQTEITLWLESNCLLKEEVQGRYSYLCRLEEEIGFLGDALSEYRAARCQGEVINMQRENKKVAYELEVGMDRVRALKDEVGGILVKFEHELGLSGSKGRDASRARVPLKSFLFGVKLKKQRPPRPTLFSCVHPLLQKQNSDAENAQLY